MEVDLNVSLQSIVRKGCILSPAYITRERPVVDILIKHYKVSTDQTHSMHR